MSVAAETVLHGVLHALEAVRAARIARPEEPAECCFLLADELGVLELARYVGGHQVRVTVEVE